MVSPSILTFPSGAALSSQCTEVTITNNDGLEDRETYVLTLESPDPSEILTGSPNTTNVHIENTDGITVSFNASQYSVLEGELVSVCAMITSGTSLIGFTLGISVTTDVEGNACKYIANFFLHCIANI